jgi:hypothetical protein
MAVTGGSINLTGWGSVNPFGVQVTASSTLVVTGLTCTAASLCIDCAASAGAAVTVTNCTLATTGGWSSIGIRGNGPASLAVAGCSFSDGGGGQFAFYNGCAGMGIQHCTFDVGGYIYYNFASGQPAASDYNTFTNLGNGGKPFNIGGTDMTEAAYRAATGQDAHSTP